MLAIFIQDNKFLQILLIQLLDLHWRDEELTTINDGSSIYRLIEFIDRPVLYIISVNFRIANETICIICFDNVVNSSCTDRPFFEERFTFFRALRTKIQQILFNSRVQLERLFRLQLNITWSTSACMYVITTFLFKSLRG